MLPERLKKLREEKGLNKSKLSSALQLPYTTYNNYETGVREPNFQMLDKLADFFDVSLGYLIGSSDFKGHNKMTEEEEGELAEDIVHEFETNLIKKYRDIDDYGKMAVDSILDIEYRRTVAQKEK